MAQTRGGNRHARSDERGGLDGAEPVSCPYEGAEDFGLRPQEFPGKSGRANRGRPFAGMHFVEADQSNRYRYADFRMAPDELTLDMFKRHEDGVTLRRLAEEYALSLSAVKRRLRNARDFLEAWREPGGMSR